MAGEKLLVVDDNSYMRKLLESRLRANSYRVIQAESGEEALQKAEAEKPDAILLDVGMPKMNGFELGRRLKANPATQAIPLVFVTARGQEEEILEATKELGASGYVIKPFTPEVLLEAIKRALQR